MASSSEQLRVSQSQKSLQLKICIESAVRWPFLGDLGYTTLQNVPWACYNVGRVTKIRPL